MYLQTYIHAFRAATESVVCMVELIVLMYNVLQFVLCDGCSKISAYQTNSISSRRRSCCTTSYGVSDICPFSRSSVVPLIYPIGQLKDNSCK